MTTMKYEVITGRSLSVPTVHAVEAFSRQEAVRKFWGENSHEFELAFVKEMVKRGHNVRLSPVNFQVLLDGELNELRMMQYINVVTFGFWIDEVREHPLESSREVAYA
jgi:hypothetical protein